MTEPRNNICLSSSTTESCIGNLDVRTRYEEAVAAMAIVDVTVIIARARPPYSHAQVQMDIGDVIPMEMSN